MKITVVLFGKPKDKNILNLVAEYEKRISRYQKMEIVYLPILKQNEKPFDIVLGKFKNASKIYILDEDGKEFSSQSCAKMYEKDLESSKEIIFAIGPSEGFGDILRLAKAKLLPAKIEMISLSKLTMQHDIAFLVLIEQLYRAISIKNNLPYHKD